MPSRPEDRIKDNFCKQAQAKYGEDIVIMKINDACSKAYPDTIICFFGRYVAFEFKNGNTPMKAHEYHQNYRLKKIQRANGFGSVIRSVADGMSALEKIKEII
jgi:hypothetical protein